MASKYDLAQAYVQIIPSADGFKSKMSSVIDPQAEQAGTEAGEKSGDSYSSGFSGGIKAAVIIAAITAVATAAVKAFSSVIENYGEYEQLIGGVETLFGESADTIVEYANNAYQTAGMSANAYMETVTSFSASLLQSLGGDTEKAAQYADMAITDMSDNANKMGTDMEAITNAYQGFAKQNYTIKLMSAA